jgi:DNA-binding Xre family transcriptional regulator
VNQVLIIHANYDCHLDNDEPPVPTAKALTYILSIFPSFEMKKAMSKHVAKTHTIQQGSDQEWDALKVQILAKICASLNPKVLDIINYTILFHIPRSVPKPGISLTKPEEYNVMIAQAIKTKNLMVYLSVMQQEMTMMERSRKRRDLKCVYACFFAINCESS